MDNKASSSERPHVDAIDTSSERVDETREVRHIPPSIDRLISAYGYANRHPEDADRIAAAYKALAEGIAGAQTQPVQDELSEFEEGQWWVAELDRITSAFLDEHVVVTPDLKRAVAVVHRLLRVLSQPPEQDTSQQWRCFHCGEVFADRAGAAEHFGSGEMHSPACKIDIAEYRAMEERMRRYNEEDSDLHRHIHALESRHQTELRREEEKGYARGLGDGQDTSGRAEYSFRCYSCGTGWVDDKADSDCPANDCGTTNRYCAVDPAAPSPAQQVASLIEALTFYADGHHFNLSDESAWDTVSGEPQNLWCDEADTATVEDGSIARAALEREPPFAYKDDAPAQQGLSDTERLDFLDRCHAALNAHYGTNYGWNLIINHNVVRLLAGEAFRDIDLHDSDGTRREYQSCRAAIDKAALAAKESGK